MTRMGRNQRPVIAPHPRHPCNPRLKKSRHKTIGRAGEYMKATLTRLLNVLLIAVIGCTAVWGQATAQISGTVRDQSSAVLPGAEITATQTETGISRNTVSNETGSFILPNLALGPYRIEVAL